MSREWNQQDCDDKEDVSPWRHEDTEKPIEELCNFAIG